MQEHNNIICVVLLFTINYHILNVTQIQHKLQVVLRAAARLVLQLPYRSSVSEAMHRAVALVGRGGPGELQDRPPRLQMSPWPSSRYLSDQCIPASTFAGRANMRSSSRLDRLLYVPRTKTKTLHAHEGSTTPRLQCGTRSRWTCVIPWTLTPLLQDKTEISLFHSWLICFSVSRSCTLLLSIYSFLFLRRARQRDVHYSVVLAWRVQMSELNWIEHIRWCLVFKFI